MFFYNYDGEKFKVTFFRTHGKKCNDIYEFASHVLETHEPCHIAYADINIVLLEWELGLC